MIYDVIVIGGGISGMSFAHQSAKAGFETLVIEKDARLGGCLYTHQADDGFWIEMGAHTCYSTYGGLLGILSDLKLQQNVIPRLRAPFRFYASGQLRSIFKELSLLGLLASSPHLFLTKKEGRTIQSYYSQIAGESNYKRVLGPLFAAVPSQCADNFPADMLFKRRKRNPGAPRSFTMVKGLSMIIDALSHQKGIHTLVGKEVVSLHEPGGSGAPFEVMLSDGTARLAWRLAIATPPSVGAVLLADRFPKAARALARIRTARVESHGVIVPITSTSIERVKAIVPLKRSFFSAVSRDVVSHPKWRGFTFHFEPGLPLDMVRAEMMRVLACKQDDVILTEPRIVEIPSRLSAIRLSFEKSTLLS